MQACRNALIGVATAAYYPTVTLSATGGYSGTSPLFSRRDFAFRCRSWK